MNERLSAWIGAYVAFARRRKGSVIGVSFVLMALGALFAARLKVTPHLDALLPRDTPTIRALKETDRRFGSSDMYTLAIVMKDPAELARVQREAKARLLEWDQVVYAQDERDNSFFLDHALLYLPKKDLARLQGNLEDLLLELGMRGPLGMDLLGGDGSGSDLHRKREWFDASLPRELGLPDEAADAFGKFLKPAGSAARDTVAASVAAAKAALPDSLKVRMMGPVGDGRWIAVVQAVLKRPSSDMDYVEKVLAHSNDAIIAPLRRSHGEALRIAVQGPYADLEEAHSIESDGLLATLVSVALNILIIVVFFRRVAPVLLIAGQVVFSCLLTLGATGLVYGRLNLYTIFVISILFGMGIDYSIYVIGYSRKLAMRGRNWTQALSETLRILFFSLLVAMLTTAGGLLCLRASRFVGFYEFGVIGAVGIWLSLLSTFLVLPAWVFQFESWGARYRWLRFLDLTPREDRAMLPGLSKVRDWPRFARATALTCLAITVFLAFFVPRGTRFEYDFANLREKPGALAAARSGEAGKDDFPIARAIASQRRSSQPVVVVSDRRETMDELHDTLLRRLTVERDTLLASFLTFRTFVPRDSDQLSRMKDLHRIDSLASASVFDRAEGDDAEMIQCLRRMAKAKPFTAEQIPPWALNLLRERDGSYGKIGFVYGNFNSSDAREAARFEERYGSFKLEGEEPRAFSSAFIYADIVRLVKEDSGRMFLLMGAVLILMLAVILRSPRYVLISAVGMAVGTIWTLGICGLLGLRLNVFNIIAITTLQGVAVDVTTYVILAYLRLGRDRIGDIFEGIAGFLVAAELTTLAGYAGMLFVGNQGVASIGKFAVVGLGSLLLTSLMLTPWLCLRLIPDSKVETSEDVVG